MSTSTPMSGDFDLILDSWLADGPPLSAERVVSAALMTVDHTRQVVRPSLTWVAPWRLPRRMVAAAATLLVILALGIGFAIASGVFRHELPRPSAPERSAEPETVHLTRLPVGTIRWTQFESPDRIVPWTELGDEIVGVNTDTDQWFFSADGSTWNPATDLPGGYEAQYLNGEQPVAFLSPDGYSVNMPFGARNGFYDWEEAPGDAAVLRRQGDSWLSLRLPVETSPIDLDGLETSSLELTAPTAGFASDWIVGAERFVRVPWSRVLGGKGSKLAMWPRWDAAAEQLEIFRPRTLEDPVATLKVEVLPSGVIEFRDADTGQLVHTVNERLHGWTAQALARALGASAFRDLTFVVQHDGALTTVPAPWPGGEEWIQQFLFVNGKYVTGSMVIDEDYRATALHLWESADGLVWQAIPADLPVLTFDYAYVAASNERLVLNFNGGSDGETLWSSADGETWTKAAVDPSDIGIPIATDFGFVLQPNYTTMLVSTDGRTWNAADLPFLPNEPSLRYVGGLLVFGPELDGDRSLTWIGRLEAKS